MPQEPYEIRPSARRTRTMSVFRENGRLVVVVPSRLTESQCRELVPPLVERLLAKEQRRRPPRGDAELTERTRLLYDRYVAPHAEGRGVTFGVRWVSTMEQRWGSCTPATGEIRISERLRGLPAWVVDYVLLHEAAHLVEVHHNARFWRIVGGYAETERARGFLEGVAHERGEPVSDA